MKCTRCGTEFEGNFCPACGTPVQKPQTNEHVCKKCGTRFLGNFCPFCGIRYDGETDEPAPAAAEAPKTAEQPANYARRQGPDVMAILKKICRWATAALTAAFGIVVLASLAGSAMSMLGMSILTGYQWLSDSTGAGYPIALLIFGILATVCGGVHIAYVALEEKRDLTAFAFKGIKMTALLGAAGTIFTAGGTITAIAAAAFINNSSLGMYASGAAVLCPLIIGIIFLLAEVAATVLGIIKKFSYHARRAPANARLPKDPSYWEGLPEYMNNDETAKLGKKLKMEFPERIAAYLVTLVTMVAAAVVIFTGHVFNGVQDIPTEPDSSTGSSDIGAILLASVTALCLAMMLVALCLFSAKPALKCDSIKRIKFNRTAGLLITGSSIILFIAMLYSVGYSQLPVSEIFTTMASEITAIAFLLVSIVINSFKFEAQSEIYKALKSESVENELKHTNNLAATL